MQDCPHRDEFGREVGGTAVEKFIDFWGLFPEFCGRFFEVIVLLFSSGNAERALDFEVLFLTCLDQRSRFHELQHEFTRLQAVGSLFLDDLQLSDGHVSETLLSVGVHLQLVGDRRNQVVQLADLLLPQTYLRLLRLLQLGNEFVPEEILSLIGQTNLVNKHLDNLRYVLETLDRYKLLGIQFKSV